MGANLPGWPPGPLGCWRNSVLTARQGEQRRADQGLGGPQLQTGTWRGVEHCAEVPGAARPGRQALGVLPWRVEATPAACTLTAGGQSWGSQREVPKAAAHLGPCKKCKVSAHPTYWHRSPGAGPG